MLQSRPRYQSIVHDSARWDDFRFRTGDIIISTPPKCGTTWMQRICSLLIFQTPELSVPLSSLSPWLDMLIDTKENVFTLLEAQTHRRFIKTHTPLDGLPQDERVTYVCVGRDPRDAALSWDNHFFNMNIEAFLTLRAKATGEELSMPPELFSVPESLEERFWKWIDDPTPPHADPCTLRATLHHYDVAFRDRSRPNVILFHYGDMTSDLEGEMRRLADALGIEVAADNWPPLIEAASFNAMKRRADDLAPDSRLNVWKDNKNFFFSGGNGRWRSFWDDAAQRRYDARVAELVSPDVAHWAHYGLRGAVGALNESV